MTGLGGVRILASTRGRLEVAGAFRVVDIKVGGAKCFASVEG